MSEEELIEQKAKDSLNTACAELKPYKRTILDSLYQAKEAIKIISEIHYVVKDDTLKREETAMLLELRDRIVKALSEVE